MQFEVRVDSRIERRRDVKELVALGWRRARHRRRDQRGAVSMRQPLAPQHHQPRQLPALMQESMKTNPVKLGAKNIPGAVATGLKEKIDSSLGVWRARY